MPGFSYLGQHEPQAISDQPRYTERLKLAHPSLQPMNINLFPTIIYSCMLGVVLFALLDTWNKPRRRQNFYLAGLFGLLLLHILGELFIYSGAY